MSLLASLRVSAQQADAPGDPLLVPPPPAPRTLKSWDEALELVHKQSPEYLANAQNIIRAEVVTRTALAAVLPRLDGQLSYTHQFITKNDYPPSNVLGLGGTLNWQVLNFRALHERTTLEENVSATKLAFADQRRQIAQRLVSAMLGTLAFARVADLNRVGLRTALDRLALTRTRLQFGEGTPLDVERAEQDRGNARAQVINGDESLRRSRETLGLALGVSEPVAAPGDLDLDNFERSVLRTCRVGGDVEARPDVAALRTRLSVAEREVEGAWLSFAPSLGLQSQYLYQSEVFVGPKSVWSVAGVLSIPLYDGGARSAAVRDARAVAEQAKQALAAARLTALVDIGQAQRAVTVLKASQVLAREQRTLAESIDRRTRDGYAQGRGTSLDLVTSAQALRAAEINLAVLAFQTAAARAEAVLANADCTY